MSIPETDDGVAGPKAGHTVECVALSADQM